MALFKGLGKTVIPLFAAIAVVASEVVVRSGEAGAVPVEPFVEVVSVKLALPLIHKSLKPDSTTLEVGVLVRGRVPKGATATVEVGSYSGDPAGNDLVYSPTSQTLPLKPRVTKLRFRVSTGTKTVTGSVVVGASIQWGFNSRHQPVAIGGQGVHAINMQPDYHQWRTELETRVP